VGWVFGRFWNRTELFFRSGPGPLAGYTDPLLTLPVADAEAKDVGVLGTVDAVDAVGAVEGVEAEIATRVSAPIAKLTAILQMHAESENALRREETTMSASASSAGFQATSQAIASPTYV